MIPTDSFSTIVSHAGNRIVDLQKAERIFPRMARMPVATRIILENLLRWEDGVGVTADVIESVASGAADDGTEIEIGFRPSRVIMQDSAGMPALIDMAVLRDKAVEHGVDPSCLTLQVRADMVVDHSVLTHFARAPNALRRNQEREFHDNRERFAFMKWAQQHMGNLTVVPPGRGIIHQINIEYLADVVTSRSVGGTSWLFPDTVIGTDSHTTMVNGIGVLGWGVGGIEAEAVMLGEPVSMLVPPVVGVRLIGQIPVGILATDIALRMTDILRRHGVVGKVVEFFGSGMASLPVADRTTIANMSPEFGSTSAFFPADAATMDYLRLTGRSQAHVAKAEDYLRRTGLWFDPEFIPDVSQIIEVDLDGLQRTVSGPSRPEQGRDLSEVPAVLSQAIGRAPAGQGEIRDGAIVIAAITSCTNTSNPAAMIAAGLVARKARQRGMTVAPHIKTTLAPGSRAVMGYLDDADLSSDLAAVGFQLAAFGCTTCVGNGGDLQPEASAAIDADDLHVTAVLSGNRNFEGRIHPRVRSNFLASPPMVVAYALAGSMLVDMTRDPVGKDTNGNPVMLADLWPSDDEIQSLLLKVLTREQFVGSYADVEVGDDQWEALEAPGGTCFGWDEDSNYIRRPPFFDLHPFFREGTPVLEAARPLMILGDSITTDHISPVGTIPEGSDAADLLRSQGVAPEDFNIYGGRRGNHHVMVRGTFAHPRLRNTMSERVGGYTRIMPDDEPASIYHAAMRYEERGEQRIVLAGERYGSGSARDWAAKGTRLLGIRAIIAKSFERIHRSNLVRMGVLPLQFMAGEDADTLGLAKDHVFSIHLDAGHLKPGMDLEVEALGLAGAPRRFMVRSRIDTGEELHYLQSGGILPYVATRLLRPH